jgi:hypothetical protein
MTKLDKQFTATLQQSPNKGGWTYVQMTGSADYFAAPTSCRSRPRSGGRSPSRPATP